MERKQLKEFMGVRSLPNQTNCPIAKVLFEANVAVELDVLETRPTLLRRLRHRFHHQVACEP